MIFNGGKNAKENTKMKKKGDIFGRDFVWSNQVREREDFFFVVTNPFWMLVFLFFKSYLNYLHKIHSCDLLLSYLLFFVLFFIFLVRWVFKSDRFSFKLKKSNDALFKLNFSSRPLQ